MLVGYVLDGHELAGLQPEWGWLGAAFHSCINFLKADAANAA